MKWIVGVDEVGRGPVAGPVYVCAFACEADALEGIVTGTKLPVRDSKKLSKKMREKWFTYLQSLAKPARPDDPTSGRSGGEKKVHYVMTKASNTEIDDKGIAVCIRAAVNNCLEKLALDLADTKVFLDGGLYAHPKFVQETLIKGDENVPVIALASIVAKVTRDGEMEELAKAYPDYFWEKNSGYGTKAHMDAIKNKGTSPLHRISFLRRSHA